VIRYALRAVPWVLVAVSCVIVVGLMALVANWPWVMWPLQGTAVGVIAGVVGWSMDERSAAVVDSLPRSWCWRTTARAVVVPLVLAVWCGCLFAMRNDIPDQLGLFVLQGVGAISVAAAVTGWQRLGGTAEPGRFFAAFVIPTATALSLVRPLAHRLPLFPVWPDDNWLLSKQIWWGLTLAAPAMLLVGRLFTSDRRRILADPRVGLRSRSRVAQASDRG
jgi:hypothetical protein